MRTEKDVATVEWFRVTNPQTGEGQSETEQYTARNRTRSDGYSTKPTSNGLFVHPTIYNCYVFEQSHGMSESEEIGELYCPPTTYLYCKKEHRRASNIGYNNVVNAAIVNAGRSEANWGESAAELGETAQLFKSGVGKAVSLANAVRRKQWKEAAEMLGLSGKQKDKIRWERQKARENAGEAAAETASTHLMIQFGILPIVDDLYTAIELFQNKLEQSPEKGDVIIGFAQESDSGVNNRYYYHLHCGRHDMPINWEWSVTCKIRYVCTNESLLYTANKFGLANPAKTLYDTLQLSFVLDWFWPVGNYLEAMSSTFGLTKSEGYVSIVSKAIQDTKLSNDVGIYNAKLKTLPYCRYFEFQRYVVTGEPLNARFRLPDLGIGKSMTALSLLAQRLGK